MYLVKVYKDFDFVESHQFWSYDAYMSYCRDQYINGFTTKVYDYVDDMLIDVFYYNIDDVLSIGVSL